MTSLKAIDDKILELKKKKEKLRERMTQTFFKKIQAHLGEDVSLELLLGFFIETWSAPSPQVKKKWEEVGSLFFRAPASQSLQKSLPARAPSHASQA